MNNKKVDKNRFKKVYNFPIPDADDLEKIILIDKTFSSFNTMSKSKPCLAANKFHGTEKTSNNEVQSECKNKSILKMSLKMNRYFPSNGCDNNSLKFEDLTPLSYITASKCEKNGKPKLEKTCKSKICGSCKNNSTKIKYKSHKAHLHVSIKSKKSMSCTHNDKCDESVCDGNESDNSNSKINHSNCSICAEKEALRSNILLHFLNQMRNIVLTKELKLNSLKMISERLVHDRKNAELLMLMDLIIRFQVSKFKEIIFQDLLSKRINPINFVKVFLKQYEFLKSLSLAYSDILKDYESSFLFLNDLSFDLINRAHFKIHLYDDCQEIQDLIQAGQFNIKEELIFDVKTSDKEKERIRIIFSDMKSDFEITSQWKDVQKKIETLLKNSFEVGKSLLKHFHSYFNILSQKKSDTKQESFDICQTDAENYIDSLRLLASNNIGLQAAANESLQTDKNCSIDCGGLESNEKQQQQHLQDDYNFDTPILNLYHCPRRFSHSNLGMKMNCQTIYDSLANVKPPSLSRSSSSTNSNGYNSCVSTSSFDDSSDEDDGDRESGGKLLYNLNHDRNACDSFSSNLHDNSVNEETKPPTPVSFNGDEDSESRFDDCLEENHKRFIFNDKEHSWKNNELNNEDIEKFNKLYESYLTENEHLLLDNSINSPNSHMSVPECIKSLQSAESLHLLLSSIMDKCKKGLDCQDNNTKRSCHSTSHFPDADSEHNIYFSSTNCGKHSDGTCSNFTDDNFSLDSNMIGSKDEDFEMDFDELSRTLSPNSIIHENLKEFEKYLGKSSENSTGTEKSRPHLHELVKTCRIYCNRLYEKNSKDQLKETDSIESLSESCRNMSDTKQTTIVIERLTDDESCGGNDDCTSTMNIDIDSNQENNCSNSNNNGANNNNLSSSETGSTGTDSNTGNASKVCNCCKCEMFGEQSYFNHMRNANVVEKLRMKLQKRKQCSMKSSQSKKSSINNSSQNNNKGTLEDVDMLVKFINGENENNDSLSSIQDINGSASKKSKTKLKSDSTTQSKMKSKISVPNVDIKTILTQQNPKPIKKLTKSTTAHDIVGSSVNKLMKNTDEKNGCENQSKPILKDKTTNKDYHSPDMENSTVESCGDVGIQHIEDDKDIYDPVVEDFKKFCEKVLVARKQRKKLPVDPTLLISELEKCQQENKNANLFK